MKLTTLLPKASSSYVSALHATRRSFRGSMWTSGASTSGITNVFRPSFMQASPSAPRLNMPRRRERASLICRCSRPKLLRNSLIF